jgi:S1-C subfamily serine protease
MSHIAAKSINGIMLIIAVAAGTSGACSFSVVEGSDPAADEKVVYGTDNRQDVYAHPDATLRERAAASTVALMDSYMIDASNPGDIGFYSQTLREAQGLCSTERFQDDPAAAFCSGTLIDSDLVLTAGHCVTDATRCSSTRFVFNYYRTSASRLQTITSADVFRCASIVARAQSSYDGYVVDFAVLRLDRAATPRFTPAPVRRESGPLSVGQPVAVIGCGSGVPFKIDSGGSVRDPRRRTLDYFVASTDTFGGNSGSGVYETTSYSVVGIIVRGDLDYINRGGCNSVYVCSESGCRGEEITYVGNAIDALCASGASTSLCGGAPAPAPEPEPAPAPEPEPAPVPSPSSGSFSYSTSNTNSALRYTIDHTVSLSAGQTIRIGTCSVAGASGTGDTYIRLYGPTPGIQAAYNDDSCGLLTYLSYSVPAGAGGTYEVRAGCYGSGSCSGTVAYTIE